MTSDDEETRPLLASTDKDRIPWTQVFALCLARTADVLFFSCIFPYIAAMVESTGVPQKDIGFYSGLIESTYSLTETITLLFVWTPLSDKIGRKPVLVVCLAGITIGGTGFGFSKSVWAMIFWRAFAGLFSGCIGTARVMLTEISTPKTQAKLFAYTGFAANLDLALGPPIGGALADPGKHSVLFQKIQLFRIYPYLLPSLFLGTFGGISTVSAWLLLKETRSWDDGKDGEDSGIPSIKQVLQSKGVLHTVLLYCAANFLIFAWGAIAPIAYHTHISLGGLGLPIQAISICYLAAAGLQCAIFLTVYSRIYDWLGTLLSYMVGNLAGVVSYGLPPFAWMSAATHHKTLTIVILSVSLAASAVHGTTMSREPHHGQAASQLSIETYSLATGQLAVNNACPGPKALGTLSSISLALSMVGRIFAPSLSSSIYAFGVSHQIFKGQLGWMVLAIAALAVALSALWFPREAEVKQAQKENTDGITATE